MARDPKLFSDFLQTNVVAGFLVWYGYYLQHRDLWAVHEWIGPPIFLIGAFLYVWNWLWAWGEIRKSKCYQCINAKPVRVGLGAIYFAFGLTFADAFIHFHHDAAPKPATSTSGMPR